MCITAQQPAENIFRTRRFLYVRRSIACDEAHGYFFILRSHFRAVTRAMWTGQRGSSSSSGLIHSVKNNLRGRSRLNSFCFSLRAAGNFYGTGVELQYVCHDNEMGGRETRHGLVIVTLTVSGWCLICLINRFTFYFCPSSFQTVTVEKTGLDMTQHF